MLSGLMQHQVGQVRLHCIKETSIVSTVFSFFNIIVQRNWKTFTSYILTISKVAILINSEYNGIAMRQFSKGAKVTLHTVVLTC